MVFTGMTRKIKEVRAVLPHKEKDEVRAALLRNDENVEKTIDFLVKKDIKKAESQASKENETNMFDANRFSNIASTQPISIRCGSCNHVFQMAPPPGSPPGTLMQGNCPECRTMNQATVPGSAPPASSQAFANSWNPSPHSPPVSVPITTQPFAPSGRQKALLIGINYRGSRASLRGCVNDVHAMTDLLTNVYGWNYNDIMQLTDDGRTMQPTKHNILAAIQNLVSDARPGDVFFFHFSGHGSQQADPHGYEEDGMNETILPVDFERNGQITDDQICELMIRPLPEGCKLTAIMDCCHSGTGLDLPFTWTHRGWKEEVNPYFVKADVQLFSGCEDSQTSADASNSYGAPAGAMTTAFVETLRRNPVPTYPQLLQEMQRSLRQRRFTQIPSLTSTQRFNFNRPFLLTEIIPNLNPQIGRIFRKKFPPKRRPIGKKDPLAGILGLGVGMAGGFVAASILSDLLF